MDEQTAAYVASSAFVPRRLTLAREAAGLTKRELASRINTTPSAVTQFENEDGRVRPSAETVARLSLALGVPPGFFAEPLHVPPLDAANCHFRSLRSATRLEQRRVVARGSMLLLLADNLERLVAFPDAAISHLRRRVAGDVDIERLADVVREQWSLGMGPISDVITLLERSGIYVVEMQGRVSKLDAFSTWRGDRPVVFLSADKRSASRRRFDAAHELGHLLMHDEVEVGNVLIEKQADRFASALLMPADTFAREFPRRISWAHLRALKRRWKVSLAAIVRRAYDLALISEATYRRAYVQLTKNGWRDSEPDEPRMETPSLLRRALQLVAEQGQTIEAIADEVQLRAHYIQSLLTPSAVDDNLSLAF